MMYDDARRDKIRGLLGRKNSLETRRQLAEFNIKRYSLSEIREWKREAKRNGQNEWSPVDF